MEINEKLEVFFGAAIGAANSQSESMLDEQKNIYQSAMEEHEQSCRDALKSSRRIFLEKQKKEVNRRNAEQTMAWKKDYQALKERKTEELFEMVKEKLLSYRRTDAYEAFLLAQIGKAKEFAQGEDLTVFISPSDQERQAVLEEKSGCRGEIAEDEFSGGMRQRAAFARAMLTGSACFCWTSPFPPRISLPASPCRSGCWISGNGMGRPSYSSPTTWRKLYFSPPACWWWSAPPSKRWRSFRSPRPSPGSAPA